MRDAHKEVLAGYWTLALLPIDLRMTKEVSDVRPEEATRI